MTDPRPAAETPALSPDFVRHPAGPAIAGMEVDGTTLRVTWSDGLTGAFNRFWLRENEVVAGIVNPVTRERDVQTEDLPEDLAITAADVDAGGAVAVTWAPDGHVSRHDRGWLRSTAEGRWHPAAVLPARVPWEAAEMPEPPTFDGNAILSDDKALQDWLEALYAHGFARLRGLPSGLGTVLQVAERIGTVRASNFGYTFRVETKDNPDSNAYTSAGLGAHTDLASREVQPGLQLLHCRENGCDGGASTMADGFAIAAHLKVTDPDAYDALTTLNWVFSNRHRESDYRFSGPIVVLDAAGEMSEIRFTAFLRSEPDMPAGQVDRAYRAVRLYGQLAADDRFVCRTLFAAGDLVIFDNRRILHGRDAFTQGSGHRRLEGCYLETDELLSRLRVLARETA
ncbi:MAG: TauD/TfdA family dioxygenase [Pseudomonadota bacterium]